jgi:putative addiction module killer protein
VDYITHVITVRQTIDFADWLRKLRDKDAQTRIQIRIRRLALGNFGDVKSVAEGVSELRINYGPGYRLYFSKRGDTLVLLLCGGDKSTQTKDITRAKALAKEWHP